MKKIKKIKIKLNGKTKIIAENYNIQTLIKDLNISLKKVAIELNLEILDKKKLYKTKLKNNDKIEIVHFIGGG
ncbi:sulfur carrier protein ThiS [Candidatus Pelagibacter sp.]|nr:sulfur carrier protein ThiS [Candidatus Pelagibacter sp.]